ncbi:unnamed protein product [Soboliphyme baturini]|uniref:LAM_G_DOMAIN domain-containing protein n=1 Tax=Soboliphyme baturini TaxID=241478 RepID=A0A183J7A4_9BILA|nr:unnamed protein product [Soboliphyme baturini]
MHFRQANSATLNVTDTEGTTTVRYDGGGMGAIFNTIPGRTALSLGVNADRKPAAVKVSDFTGVVGQIVFDGQRVPLWNFIVNERCEGSFPKTGTPAMETALQRGFLFRDGYAQVKPNGLMYDVRKFNIQVNFATYSESGLIYFRGDPNTKDFVSIELVEGHVVLQFYLGGRSKLRLDDDQRSVSYSFLMVDRTATVLCKLKRSDMACILFRWFDYHIQWKGFYGCIRSVSHGYGQKIDIAKANKSLHVEDGCVETNGRLTTADRVISFSGRGVFEMQGFAFGVDSSLAFNFLTESANAVLFYESNQLKSRRRRQVAEKEFFAAYLSSGHLVVHLGTGRSFSVTLETENVYNDGRLHAVFIRRQKNGVSLFVNDHLMDTVSFPSSDTIGSLQFVLFLGGLGKSDAPADELPVTNPLTGCLSDFFLNFKRLSLIPQYLENAQLGYCVSVFSDGLYGKAHE